MFSGMVLGIGFSPLSLMGGASPITAIIQPTLGSLLDGDQISSELSADIAAIGNYVSTQGSIANVNLVVRVNGNTATVSDTVGPGDVVAITVTVTDTAIPANVRVWSLGTTAASVDLLYTGGIGGASYLPDTGAVFADTGAATPATFGGSIARVNPSGGQAINALQSSASLCPLLGRAPKERRNLLTWTEDFSNAFWTKINVTTSIHSGAEWNVTEDTSTGLHSVRPFGQAFVSGAAYSWSVEAKLISGTRNVRFASDNSGIIVPITVFNISNGTIVSVAGGVSATITPLGDGWYRLTATATAISSGVTQAQVMQLASGTSASYTGDGTSTVRFRKPQLELGSTATAYQSVGAAVDMTEAGVPSYPFIRLDLSDDRLDTVLPQAVTGDVVIAGRNGSVIAPHSYAANTTFQLGPTSYTGGTPGILRAIGDVVGWSILGKTLTAAERERLMRFYKRRGAKGLLVPGTGLELVTNGGFDTDTDWTKGTGWTIAGGVATKAAGTAAGLDQAETLIAGAAYLLTYTVTRSAGTLTPQFTGGPTQGGVSVNASGTYTQVLVAVTGNATLRFQGDAAFAGTLDTVSLRRIRPEEDW